jgi:hypothetical protein
MDQDATSNDHVHFQHNSPSRGSFQQQKNMSAAGFSLVGPSEILSRPGWASYRDSTPEEAAFQNDADSADAELGSEEQE